MIIYVDIDNTITVTRGTNYSAAKPIPVRIQKINSLYNQGNIIIYWTARGSKTGKDWYTLTKSQLDTWGAHYHDLKMGKPAYDLFIDDKNINSERFFRST